MAPSLNTIGAEWSEENGRVAEFRLRQSAPDDHPTLRPHYLEVALLDAGGAARVIPVSFEDPVHRVPEAIGTASPVFVYPNHGDHGFAKVALDPVSIAWATSGLSRIEDPLLRQQVWASLWEMVRDQRFSSLEYLDLVRTRLPEELNLTIVQMVTSTAVAALGRYVPEDRIDAESGAFVAAAAGAVGRLPSGDLQVLWMRALLRAVAGPEDVTLATGLVDDPPEGLAIDQDMRWSAAVSAAALAADGVADRLAVERERDPSDRGDRALARAVAAGPDPASKEQVWERLHSHGYGSLHLALAAAGGFWQRSQREMLEPFVPRFFEGLPGLFAEWEVEAARGYFNTFFPHYRVAEDTLDRTAGLLERDDLGPILRRMLVEEDDVVRRSLACRAFAAPPPEEPSAEEGDDVPDGPGTTG
jgi:aminopeptidase N